MISSRPCIKVAWKGTEQKRRVLVGDQAGGFKRDAVPLATCDQPGAGQYPRISGLQIVMFGTATAAVGGDALKIAGAAQHPVVPHHLPGQGARVDQGQGEGSAASGGAYFAFVVGHLVATPYLGGAALFGLEGAGEGHEQRQ